MCPEMPQKLGLEGLSPGGRLGLSGKPLVGCSSFSRLEGSRLCLATCQSFELRGFCLASLLAPSATHLARLSKRLEERLLTGGRHSESRGRLIEERLQGLVKKRASSAALSVPLSALEREMSVACGRLVA